ncbi:uncharacterized protein RCC_08616 [Ramularia collo-cygni]|uniref:Bys1 family protein n=1 Tax=Ramularia collo-cygni TaxID=112498 RepID=A0A2D3VI77_9PEZI|nr:uncharacterized protein RCC_08616 [Ramularia collo-cygni]CZT22909.1 uncharacterized protein RCC_08616 [Ramularia collo-cygni]
MISNIAIAVLSLAAVTSASKLQINNHCTELLWLTIAKPSDPYPKPFSLASGEAYDAGTNSGEGNSVGVTFSKDFYSEGTPKFILGYSIAGDRLWWSVGKSNGDVFDGKHFNVTTPDRDGKNVCESVSSYEQKNNNCVDGSFTLTFNPCFE